MTAIRSIRSTSRSALRSGATVPDCPNAANYRLPRLLLTSIRYRPRPPGGQTGPARPPYTLTPTTPSDVQSP
jgi:hypothetical protein